MYVFSKEFLFCELIIQKQGETEDMGLKLLLFL